MGAPLTTAEHSKVEAPENHAQVKEQSPMLTEAMREWTQSAVAFGGKVFHTLDADAKAILGNFHIADDSKSNHKSEEESSGKIEDTKPGATTATGAGDTAPVASKDTKPGAGDAQVNEQELDIKLVRAFKGLAKRGHASSPEPFSSYEALSVTGHVAGESAYKSGGFKADEFRVDGAAKPVESNEPSAHANPAAAGNKEAAMPDSGQWVVAGPPTIVDDANSTKSVSKKGQ